MRNLFSIFKKKEIKKDEYKVVTCKQEYGVYNADGTLTESKILVHYEIWKNGEPQYKEQNAKFGKRITTERWSSYRMACRALQNMHYNNSDVFAKCVLGINF